MQPSHPVSCLLFLVYGNNSIVDVMFLFLFSIVRKLYITEQWNT